MFRIGDDGCEFLLGPGLDGLSPDADGAVCSRGLKLPEPATRLRPASRADFTVGLR
jgi:hypothetical protein